MISTATDSGSIDSLEILDKDKYNIDMDIDTDMAYHIDIDYEI